MNALEELIQQGVDKDEPICIEVSGLCCEATSIAVVVQSDNWVSGTVVVMADILEDGEADDG